MPLPNLVYLHSHDTGRRISPYGHAVQTPHLQVFASQGTRFVDAHCVGPTCSPSRAGLLTGQWAHCSGMIGLAHRGFRLTDPSQHVAHHLRAHGYQTVLAGLQHVASWQEPAQGCGYDLTLPHDRHTVADAAVGFLRSTPRQPFFLDAGFFETHRDFPPPAADSPETDPVTASVPAYLPDTADTRRDAAAFNTMARRLDTQYGRILAAIEDAGLSANTIVLITTDHGEAFPTAKCSLTARGTGVLLMLRGPGIPAGRAVDALVSHVDVLPTLAELAGIPTAPHWQGHSLIPLLAGSAGPVRNELFAEVTYHAAYEPMRAIRTARHCYIRRFGERKLPVLANCDDGISKDVMLAAGWGQIPTDREQLYDRTLDPLEQRNLAADPAAAALLADLRLRLDRWMHATNDPLLGGDVPPPPGSQVNDADDPTPNRPPMQF